MAEAPTAEGPAPVRLNLYDLSVNLNKSLRLFGTGAFHAAVEVYGYEWSYGYSDSGTGIFAAMPQQCAGGLYRESLEMGETTLSEKEVDELLLGMCEEWRGMEYDLLRHNCCSFSATFCKRLGVRQVPPWVTNLAAAGAMVGDGLIATAHAAHNAKILAAAKTGKVDEKYQELRGTAHLRAKDILSKAKGVAKEGKKQIKGLGGRGGGGIEHRPLLQEAEPLDWGVGDRVEGLYGEKRRRWFKAVIAEVREDGTYLLDWEDGDQLDRVKEASELRRRKWDFSWVLDLESAYAVEFDAYSVGDKVEARHRATAIWFPAIVSEVMDDGTHVISWEDGDPKDRHKRASDLRLRVAAGGCDKEEEAPALAYTVGEPVEARYTKPRRWFRAVIGEVLEDGTYIVDWEDKDPLDRHKGADELRRRAGTARRSPEGTGAAYTKGGAAKGRPSHAGHAKGALPKPQKPAPDKCVIS